MANTLKTVKSVVAFIDVLGVTEKIVQDADGSLNMIHECYDYASRGLKECFPKNLIIPNINIFSDNIVLSLPFDDLEDDEQFLSFPSIMAYTSFIILYFWMNQMLVRGGITIGSFYSDGLMVWGNGLVKSYQLENQVAVYPRVVIDPQCKEITDTYREMLGHIMMVSKDFDGIDFVDPFYKSKKILWEKYAIDFYNDNARRIEEIGDKKPKILQKLLWFQNYLAEKLQYVEREKSNG